MSAEMFDIHQHYGALIGVPGSGGRVTTPQEDCANRIEFLDSFGIDQAALMPGHSYAAPRGFADIRAINDGLHVYADLAPERFPAVFGTLDPRHGSVNYAEVERLAAMGFRGLSWHRARRRAWRETARPAAAAATAPRNRPGHSNAP